MRDCPREPGWGRKTADIRKYNREYRLARIESDPEAEREREREKYAKKMRRIHGDDWAPSRPMNTDEKRVRKAELSRNKYRKRKADPVAHKRMLARKSAMKAVKSGRLVPLPCFVCGEVAEAHHPSYDLPLAVAWLCPEHHRQLHREFLEMKTNV